MPLAPDSVPLPITVTPLAFATLNCPPLLAQRAAVGHAAARNTERAA